MIRRKIQIVIYFSVTMVSLQLNLENAKLLTRLLRRMVMRMMITKIVKKCAKRVVNAKHLHFRTNYLHPLLPMGMPVIWKIMHEIILAKSLTDLFQDKQRNTNGDAMSSNPLLKQSTG